MFSSVRKAIANKSVLQKSLILQVRKYSQKEVKPEKPPPQLVIEKIGKVTTIGINRHAKRNSVDSNTANELSQAVSNFENDKESLVGVLHGIGGNFCAGFDLNELCGEKIRPELLLSPDGSMGPTRRHISKPLIGAISGYAVAGGFELALMCDLRVVEDTAVMGVFCRRFGIPLIDGGTVRLTAMVGLSRALDLILTGRAICAKEAFEWGLANRIVATGTALGQAINLANSLVKFPQDCMLADRASALNAAYEGNSLQQSLEYELRSANKEILAQAQEGAQKFMKGAGKHGKFYSLTEKEVADWEKDEMSHEAAAKEKNK